ncbi:hypothetical protein ACC716_11340 [Rhizobium johnstonii]|uniref:hypothetical protein n=1 Tax=Rhizobium TaxID=379 RepID=UPI0013EF3961|nr:hypothetical protein [Rhizobium leguminosarum]
MAKGERQLNFLLSISNARGVSVETKPTLSSVTPTNVSSEKRYMQIKQSLKNKGLIKPR